MNTGFYQITQERSMSAILEAGIEIVEQLENHGHQAVVVGGCVRDWLLERPMNDIDIATSALPNQVKSIFAQTYDTGLAHGTVTVVFEGVAAEVTTFRSEGEYLDGRRPSSVNFGASLEEDLARRDFTMNAIALSSQGRLIDPFNGAEDIKSGLIRAVGNPLARLQEDRLRKVRLLRFQAQLGFEIDPALYRALVDFPELSGVSAERLQTELHKLFLGHYAIKAIQTMQSSGVFDQLFGELVALKAFDQGHPAHLWDALTHTLKVFEGLEGARQAMCLGPLDQEWQLALSWAALYHDAGKPHAKTIDEMGICHYYGHQKVSEDLFIEASQTLKLSKSLSAKAKWLIGHHMDRPELQPKAVKRWMNKVFRTWGAPGVDQQMTLMSGLLTLMYADALGTGTYGDQTYYQELQALVKGVFEVDQVFDRRALKINGNELMTAIPVLQASPHLLKLVFDDLVQFCLEAPESNTKDLLLERALYWTKVHLHNFSSN